MSGSESQESPVKDLQDLLTSPRSRRQIFEEWVVDGYLQISEAMEGPRVLERYHRDMVFTIEIVLLG